MLSLTEQTNLKVSILYLLSQVTLQVHTTMRIRSGRSSPHTPTGLHHRQGTSGRPQYAASDPDAADAPNLRPGFANPWACVQARPRTPRSSGPRLSEHP